MECTTDGDGSDIGRCCKRAKTETRREMLDDVYAILNRDGPVVLAAWVGSELWKLRQQLPGRMLPEVIRHEVQQAKEDDSGS